MKYLAILLIFIGCQKDVQRCCQCQIHGHPEIYIPEFCGNEEEINQEKESYKKIYSSLDGDFGCTCK